MNYFFAFILTIVIAGCASVPEKIAPLTVQASPTRLTAYEFTGRISVKQDEKGNYGNIHWVKHGADIEITLTSPLGQIVAQIYKEANGVRLILGDRRQYHAENGEMLTKQVLGYVIPVSGLSDWLLGAPVAGTANEPHLGPDGLPDKLQQDGWTIQYIGYTTVNGRTLPKRMMLNRDGVEIRLAIDQWIF